MVAKCGNRAARSADLHAVITKCVVMGCALNDGKGETRVQCWSSQCIISRDFS